MKTQEEIDKFRTTEVKDFDLIQDSQMIKSGFFTTNSNFLRLKKYLVLFKEFFDNLYDLLNINKLLKEVKKDFEKNKNKLVINFDSLVIDNVYYMNIPNDDRTYQVIKKDPSKIHISLKDSAWETNDIWCYVKSYSGETLYPSIKTENNEIIISFSVTQFEPIIVYWL